MKTTRYKCKDVCQARRASLLLTLCAMLAGCGNQAAGHAGKAPGGHALAYLLFPLSLGSSPPDGAGTGGTMEMPAHDAKDAVQSRMAPGAAVSAMPGSQAAVVRGINQVEQIVGSYRQASGERRAFIWTASHGMRDLNTLVRDKPSGLTLSDALAISDAGAIVAQGSTGLVLLRPLSGPVDVPAMPLGD